MTSGIDDRYTIPGSGGVLRNQLGLRTAAELDEALNDHATLEWVGLLQESAPVHFDFAYLANIHRRLFGRVLGDDVVGHWSGQVRSNAAPMGAMGTGIVYASEGFIQQNLDELFGVLEQKHYLVGLDAGEFFGELADFWGFLTQIHPFRDGNTRSQAAFVDRLAVNAGYPIKWSGIEVDQLRELRLVSIRHPRGLAAYLEEHASHHEPWKVSIAQGPEILWKTRWNVDSSGPAVVSDFEQKDDR